LAVAVKPGPGDAQKPPFKMHHGPKSRREDARGGFRRRK
jgi:hypothetical protein